MTEVVPAEQSSHLAGHEANPVRAARVQKRDRAACGEKRFLQLVANLLRHFFPQGRRPLDNRTAQSKRSRHTQGSCDWQGLSCYKSNSPLKL